MAMRIPVDIAYYSMARYTGPSVEAGQSLHNQQDDWQLTACKKLELTYEIAQKQHSRRYSCHTLDISVQMLETRNSKGVTKAGIRPIRFHTACAEYRERVDIAGGRLRSEASVMAARGTVCILGARAQEEQVKRGSVVARSE